VRGSLWEDCCHCGNSALAGCFVEDNGSRGRDVEGADTAGHGNAQEMIAGAANEIVETRALAAEDDDEIAGEIELVVVGLAAFVEPDDPKIVLLEIFKRADEVDDASDAEVLGRTGTGFNGYGTEGRGAALGEDNAVDSGAIGNAQKRTKILRIFNSVECEDETGRRLDRAGSKRSSMVRNSCGRTSATTPWWAGVLAVRLNWSRDSWRTRTPAWRHCSTRC